MSHINTTGTFSSISVVTLTVTEDTVRKSGSGLLLPISKIIEFNVYMLFCPTCIPCCNVFHKGSTMLQTRRRFYLDN